jgi:hypothetical protein
MITYKRKNQNFNVYVENKLVGIIKEVPKKQYQYFPKGSKLGGKIFNSVEQVKQSLEL